MNKNSIITGFFAAAAVFCTQTFVSAQTSIALNVNWRADRKVNDAQSYQVNLWDGVSSVTSSNTNYKNNLVTLKPGMVRVHAYEIYNQTAGYVNKCWVSGPTTGPWTWNAAKIAGVYTSFRSALPIGTTDFMQNIPSWPTYMQNSTGQLGTGTNGAADYRQIYADWCAALVKIVNKDNAFAVKYWEPLNEVEDSYLSTTVGDGKDAGTLADIYNRCAIAMKDPVKGDPTIIVGGPAATSVPSTQTSVGVATTAALQIFIAATKNNLGFFSYHSYLSGAPGNSTDIYNRARNVGGYNTSFARALLNGQGVSPTLPIYIGESNMSYTYMTDQNVGAMKSMFGATSVALTLKSFGENVDGAGLQFWNDADGIYGLIKGTTVDFRGSGRVLSLANIHMIGTSVGVTTSNNGALDLYAVKSTDGTKKTVMIVNTSDVYSDDPATTTTTARVFKAGTPYTAALTFSDGWPSPAATTSNYTVYTISGTSIPPGTTNNTTSDVGFLTSSTGTYTAGTTLNIPINGNEIKFVVFSDVTNDPNQLVRNPEADCYVSSNTPTNPATNSTSLNVYGPSAESFLRFDVSNVGGPITSAKLRLYPTTVNAAAAVHRLDQATSNSWSETTMSWVTKPATTLAYYPTWTNLVKNVRTEIDVTAAAQTAANSTDKKISFRISSQTTGGDNRYGSRETLIESRPELVIVRSPAQPVSLISSQDTTVNQIYPTNNYSTSNVLDIKLTGSGADVEGYIQFNLAGVTSVSSAILSVNAIAIDTANRENWLGLAPSNWTETQISWSNKPGSTEDIGGAFVPVTGQDVVKDVTAQVQAAIASGKISFRIYSKIQGGYNRYGTKEQTDPAKKPQLDITP